MYDPDKILNGERASRTEKLSERLRAVLSGVVFRLTGDPSVPDLDNRHEVVVRQHLHQELDQLAERLVLLEEVARGARLSLLGEQYKSASLPSLTEWHQRFEWEIGGFFDHYQRSSTYETQDLCDAIELAKRLLAQAEFYFLDSAS